MKNNVKKTFKTLKEHEKESRRDVIISAAERVFAKKPFGEVTIRDVAREAGISHALIYRYFPDQQSLFVEACFRGGAKIVAFISRLIDENRDISIQKVTRHYLQYLIDNDRFFRMMTHFMLDGSLTRDMIDRFNEGERVLLDQFDRLFEKTHGKKNARALSHAYFAAMNGILITFSNYPGRSSEKVASHMHELGQIIAVKFKQ